MGKKRETAQEAALKETRRIVDTVFKTMGAYYNKDFTEHGENNHIFGIDFLGEADERLPINSVNISCSTMFPESLFEVSAHVRALSKDEEIKTIVIGRYRHFDTADAIAHSFQDCSPEVFEEKLIFADELEKAEAKNGSI